MDVLNRDKLKWKTFDYDSVSDVNLPVKYVCGKKTDFLPFFTGKVR